MFLNIFSHKLTSAFTYFLLINFIANAIVSPKGPKQNDFDDEIVPPYEPESERFVVMSRHGETIWSRDEIFCGWYDSPLTEKGKNDAKKCAELFNYPKYQFNKAFSSVLSRAEDSLVIMLETINQPNVPVQKSWRLNERHYGELTGQYKTAVNQNMVNIWRRSYDEPPPAMDNQHTYYTDICENEAIVNSFKDDYGEFPASESLKTTKDRVVPYWEQVIKPAIQNDKRVLIVAHGTVLKALIMHIEELTPEQICKVELPTAVPFVYEFNRNMRLSKKKVFLGDPKEIEQKMIENSKIKGCTINE